eukprot:CAMPEP_0183453478 /NCGR_PEP_ID=MMETSP0370-20130417/121076_1 /TAXON_ID=268820 /ORGANISM="Peridinium aciculiferum, Strain PAER-2" /LENGTH=51 /DNA_ID=CAMNT_0025644875 /DNA_START=108 /DNA_END=259 /DNA_ORIENTATION=+
MQLDPSQRIKQRGDSPQSKLAQFLAALLPQGAVHDVPLLPVHLQDALLHRA